MIYICIHTHADTHTLWCIQEPEVPLHMLHTFYLFTSDTDYK